MAKPAIPIINRKAVLANGTIIPIRVWRLPAASEERPHGLKYSLFYGRPGKRITGYDNEAGKGDHRHYGGREEYRQNKRHIAEITAVLKGQSSRVFSPDGMCCEQVRSRRVDFCHPSSVFHAKRCRWGREMPYRPRSGAAGQ
jgi:hypothetical protein